MLHRRWNKSVPLLFAPLTLVGRAVEHEVDVAAVPVRSSAPSGHVGATG